MNNTWQTILEVGGEGSSVTLLGKKQSDHWKFKMATDESSLKCFLDREDLPLSLTSESGAVSTWEEALELLGRYKWASLYPLEVHSEFLERIILAVSEMVDSPSFIQHREHFRWDNWKKVVSEDEISTKVQSQHYAKEKTPKAWVHHLINEIALEVLHYIRTHESSSEDRWVPAAKIRNGLELNFVAVPKGNKQYGEKGWFFAIIARILEDQNLVEYKKVGTRAYYRTIVDAKSD